MRKICYTHGYIEIMKHSTLTMGALQSERLFLSHAYTEIFPICDNSAVYKDTDSQETSAEYSKEVPIGGKEISRKRVQTTKAFTSRRCAPACHKFAALFPKYHGEEFLSQQ